MHALNISKGTIRSIRKHRIQLKRNPTALIQRRLVHRPTLQLRMQPAMLMLRSSLDCHRGKTETNRFVLIVLNIVMFRDIVLSQRNQNVQIAGSLGMKQVHAPQITLLAIHQ